MKATVVVAPTTPDAQLGFVLGARGFDIRVTRGELHTLADLFGALSGAYTLEEIASMRKLPLSAVSAVVDQLAACGLVYDYATGSAREVVDPALLIGAFESLVCVLRFDLFRHELFARVPADEGMFLATAIEYFHLIRDAPVNIALALQHAPAALVSLLQEYLESEKDHHVEIGKALQGAIGGCFDLDDLVPLASTEAAILKTQNLARMDTLAYAACCAFAESRATGRTVASSNATTHWRSASLDLLNAFMDHAFRDGEEEHFGLFAACVHACRSKLPTGRAAAILTSVHEFKHYMDNMNFEILRANERPGAPTPRLRARLLDYDFGDE